MKYQTEIIIDPQDDLVDELRQALKEHDQSKIGMYESSSVILCIRGKEKNIIAGAHVYFEFGCLHLDVLWVDENHRGLGLGKQLLAECETIAIARGVHRCWLLTTSFQALDFYTKQGYTVFEEFNVGQHTNYFLKKDVS